MFKNPLRREVNRPITDLDRITSKEVGFMLHGKKHTIRPMTAMQFFDFSQSLWEIQNLAKQEKVLPRDLIEKYYNLAKIVSDDITVKDIEKCSVQQLSALYSLILRTVQGDELSKEKIEQDVKKNLTVKN